MKKIIFFIGLLALALSTYAQKTIAVLSGTTWTFYDDFSPALRAAQAGSTIYVPGGTFILSDNADTINKPLTIIGTGFSLDSANATGITRLKGYMYLDNGADNTTFEGISFEVVQSLNTVSVYSNILIRRCYINSLYFGVWNSNYGKNYYVTESVICYLDGGSAPGNNFYAYNNLKVEKCIITGGTSGCYGSVFNNNIMKLNQNYVFGPDIGYCEFSNNIIVDSTYGAVPATSSSFKNNIFRSVNTGWLSTNNLFVNNTWNISPYNLFINSPSFDGTCNSIYNQNQNLHLKSNAIAKNYGDDGTDAGIYGTSSPCKDGWVPSDPHISAKTIGSSTLSNGILPVNIKVIAQDR